MHKVATFIFDKTTNERGYTFLKVIRCDVRDGKVFVRTYKQQTGPRGGLDAFPLSVEFHLIEKAVERAWKIADEVPVVEEW